MSDIQNFLNYKAAGPVSASFLKDREHDVRALLGPVGGGKSVACVYDCLRNASMTTPCNDGIIRYRIAIIGQTYGQIERNLMPTWTAWLPADGGNWTEGEMKGGGGRSATHKLRWMAGNKEVRFEAVFAAIGDNAAEDFMRGFEPTAFWLYEMDLLAEDVLDQALFRIGRYPATSSDGRPDAVPGHIGFRNYVIGDLNAPDIDSWFYRRFEEDRPPGHKVYKQPSGRHAKAENVHNLPKGYYDRQVAILSAKRGGKHLVRRMVDAKYGPTLMGEPVYPEYSDDVHLAPAPLAALEGVPLLLGFDQEIRRPACVIVQLDPRSKQYRVLSEVVPGRMGARRFAEMVNREIAEIAPGLPIEGAWCDPTGFDGADKEDGELAWAETVMQELGTIIWPSPSNELDLRLDAVTEELIHELDNGLRGIIISPRCKMLRKGFASHYFFAKSKAAGSEGSKLKPDKNEFSDPHDALQYVLLGHKGRHGVVMSSRRDRDANRRGVPRAASSGSVRLRSSYDVLA